MVILFKIYFNWINYQIENGNIYCWGANDYGQLGIGNNFNRNKPQQYLENPKFIFISCGYNHTIGITGFLIFKFNKINLISYSNFRKWWSLQLGRKWRRSIGTW